MAWMSWGYHHFRKTSTMMEYPYKPVLLFQWFIGVIPIYIYIIWNCYSGNFHVSNFKNTVLDDFFGFDEPN
jgi:uncharacterized membrane protein (DUF373 family)